MARFSSYPEVDVVQAPSRRDRVRAATTEEIKQTARRILVSEGPEAVSLRAIAREMGMTAPALYRHCGSDEELIKHVSADIFTDLASDLPLGLLLVFLRCWVRLYGIVSLEVFGHLSFALDDGKPMFELMLSEMAPQVGLQYPVPRVTDE